MNSRHLDQTVDKVSVFTEHTFNEGLFFLESVLIPQYQFGLGYFTNYRWDTTVFLRL